MMGACAANAEPCTAKHLQRMQELRPIRLTTTNHSKMSAVTSIPRFLLPRGAPSLRRQQAFLRRLQLPATSSPPVRRHASTQPNKPLVLEKPERFNPPSHGARVRAKPRSYPGPALSEVEREEQKTKQYPHMMPAEGTFMHWFLTNKMLHTFITLVYRIPPPPPTPKPPTLHPKKKTAWLTTPPHPQQTVLLTLAFSAVINNLQRTSPYASDLPPTSLFFRHPLRFLGQYFEVYKLHTAYISAQTAERRRKKVEDVQKRAEFRKAHGMDQGEGFGGWTARKEGERLGPALEMGAAEASPMAEERGAGAVAEERGVVADGKGVYTDFEGRRKPVRKWLGIW